MADNEILDKIEGHLSTLVKLQLAPILDRELGDDFARRLWALTGETKRNDIMKKLKCGPNQIAQKWARWEQLGLIVRDGKTTQKTM